MFWKSPNSPSSRAGGEFFIASFSSVCGPLFSAATAAFLTSHKVVETMRTGIRLGPGVWEGLDVLPPHRCAGCFCARAAPPSHPCTLASIRHSDLGTLRSLILKVVPSHFVAPTPSPELFGVAPPSPCVLTTVI